MGTVEQQPEVEGEIRTEGGNEPEVQERSNDEHEVRYIFI